MNTDLYALGRYYYEVVVRKFLYLENQKIPMFKKAAYFGKKSNAYADLLDATQEANEALFNLSGKDIKSKIVYVDFSEAYLMIIELIGLQLEMCQKFSEGLMDEASKIFPLYTPKRKQLELKLNEMLPNWNEYLKRE